MVVRGGHAALDRALARAAARNAAQPPVSALRAACLATLGTTVPTRPDAATGSHGRMLDAVCVTADRDDPRTRVVHVATVREVPSPTGWYRVRTWRELSVVSAN